MTLRSPRSMIMSVEQALAGAPPLEGIAPSMPGRMCGFPATEATERFPPFQVRRAPKFQDPMTEESIASFVIAPPSRRRTNL